MAGVDRATCAAATGDFSARSWFGHTPGRGRAALDTAQSDSTAHRNTSGSVAGLKRPVAAARCRPTSCGLFVCALRPGSPERSLTQAYPRSPGICGKDRAAQRHGSSLYRLDFPARDTAASGIRRLWDWNGRSAPCCAIRRCASPVVRPRSHQCKGSRPHRDFL